MIPREEIERLLAALASDPNAATVTREGDGTCTVHDHTTGRRYVTSWDQALRIRAAGAIYFG